MCQEILSGEPAKPGCFLADRNRKKVLTCYGYSKPGHFARDYRSKGAIPKPQLNIIERKVSLGSKNQSPRQDTYRERLPQQEDILLGQNILLEATDNLILKLNKVRDEFEEERNQLKQDTLEVVNNGEGRKEVLDQGQERQPDPNEIIRKSQEALEFEDSEEELASCIPASTSEPEDLEEDPPEKPSQDSEKEEAHIAIKGIQGLLEQEVQIAGKEQFPMAGVAMRKYI